MQTVCTQAIGGPYQLRLERQAGEIHARLWVTTVTAPMVRWSVNEEVRDAGRPVVVYFGSLATHESELASDTQTIWGQVSGEFSLAWAKREPRSPRDFGNRETESVAKTTAPASPNLPPPQRQVATVTSRPSGMRPKSRRWASAKESSPWRLPAIAASVFASLVAAFLIAVPGFFKEPTRTIVGGCERFNIYAQNQFDPRGTLIWETPSPSANNHRGFAANQLIAVDGWVRTRTPYPSNQTPWDSDVWFHLANGAGWVSFAGVRAVPTEPAPNGNFAPGTSPPPTDSRCSGTLRS